MQTAMKIEIERAAPELRLVAAANRYTARDRAYQEASLAMGSGWRSGASWTPVEVADLVKLAGENELTEVARLIERPYLAVKKKLERERARRRRMRDEGVGKLRLADVIAAGGVSYADVAAGAGIARSTLFRLAREGRFPSNRNMEEVRRLVEAELVRRGLVSEDQAGAIWDDAAGTEASRRYPQRSWRGRMHNRMVLAAEVLEAFGLARDPFALAPAGMEGIYESAGFKFVQRTLAEAVRLRGWVALCADIGAGKSTALTVFMARTRESNPRVVFWKPAFAEQKKLNVRGVMEWIVRRNDQSPRSSHPALQSQVEDILIERYRERAVPVLIIDEAHHLTVPMLSALKSLYELRAPEAPLDPLFAIILIGQETLRDRMTVNQNVREVAQRVAILDLPEARESIPGYLRHRIRQAGGSPDEVLTDGAAEFIRDYARTYLEAGNICAAAMKKAAECGQAKITKEWISGYLSDHAAASAAAGSSAPGTLKAVK